MSTSPPESKHGRANQEGESCRYKRHGRSPHKLGARGRRCRRKANCQLQLSWALLNWTRKITLMARLLRSHRRIHQQQARLGPLCPRGSDLRNPACSKGSARLTTSAASTMNTGPARTGSSMTPILCLAFCPSMHPVLPGDGPSTIAFTLAGLNGFPLGLACPASANATAILRSDRRAPVFGLARRSLFAAVTASGCDSARDLLPSHLPRVSEALSAKRSTACG